MLRPLSLALLLTLSACATDTPLNFACSRIDDFRTALPVTPLGSARVEGDDPLSRRIGDALAAPAGGVARVGPPNVLILSGGGQWGAYGAGLLKGWSAQSGPRPDFQVVTGVSTGALQATYAFLGRDAPLVDAYSIEDEKELVDRHGSLFFLSHGASADLAPLRAVVLDLASKALIADVAEQGRTQHRLLLVGAVDALDGRMYALDLTAIAQDATLSDEERRECYAGAIVASAAIPLVFRQVTIGGVPYYDGGVRNSVFVGGLQAATARALAERGLAGQPAGVYILVNGVPGVTPKPAVKAALLPTLGRLKSITFDQIEQDSIFAAHYAAQQRYGTKAVTYTASALGHGCAPADDDAIFDPEFMACLIRRGEATWAQGSPWKPYPKP